MVFKLVDRTYTDGMDYGGSGESVVLRLLKYVVNSKKTMGKYIGCRGFIDCDLKSIERQFYATQILYNKLSGDRLVHFIVSLDWELEADEELAMAIANTIADIIGREHHVVFGVHANYLPPHIHFIVNPVSYINGKRYIYNTTKIKMYGVAIKKVLEALAPDVDIKSIKINYGWLIFNIYDLVFVTII